MSHVVGPVRILETVRFGENFELDQRAYELRRSGRVLKLERIPMELLLLLVEQRDSIVTREQIVERIWGPGFFSTPTTASTPPSAKSGRF